jgi:histidyl-tRNA synthetase
MGAVTALTYSPLQRSRGMRDMLPGEMRAFRRVEDAFRAASARWGYEEIRTPTIELYSLYTNAGALTPAMLSRVYSFLDWDGWSGERVVLRPDSTIPVARAAAEAGLALPARLSYVQNVFRFSEHEDREDWQCGLEFLGAPAGTGDLEVIAAGCETLEDLGLVPAVRVGHVGVHKAVAGQLGANGHGHSDAGLAGLRASVTDARLAGFVDVALREARGIELLGNLEALAAACLPAALPALADVRGLTEALVASGRDVIIDLGMPRDFEYYTGVVFEFEAGGARWGTGGRYAPGGEGTPATACGLAIEAGALARHLTPGTRRPLTVSVVPATSAHLAEAMRVARGLHPFGIAAALAAEEGDGPITVHVGNGVLRAVTPDGETPIEALDDLVELCIRYK